MKSSKAEYSYINKGRSQGHTPRLALVSDHPRSALVSDHAASTSPRSALVSDHASPLNFRFRVYFSGMSHNHRNRAGTSINHHVTSRTRPYKVIIAKAELDKLKRWSAWAKQKGLLDEFAVSKYGDIDSLTNHIVPQR